MSIHVTDFKWEKGKNDLQYIELLEKTLKNEQVTTAKAIAKIRNLSKELSEQEQDVYEKAYFEGHDKGYSTGYFVGYHDAIEKFASELSNKDNIVRYDIDELMECSGNFDFACDCIRGYVNEIAVQLKAGK